jgi:hypothetical protein
VYTGITAAPSSKAPFATYATSLLKRKIARGEIVSAAGIQKWEMVFKRLFDIPPRCARSGGEDRRRT